MFDNEPAQQPQPQQSVPPPSIPPEDIHTMPERFLDSSMGGPAAAPSGGKMRKALIITLVVVVVGALGAGAWYYYTKKLANKNENGNVNATTNVNANRNLNVNVNTNTTLNTNLNANVNVNTNTTLNTNLNANVNVNTNTNKNATIGSPLPNSVDSDSDGLTDIEEAVYGTSTTNADTDADGFIDGYRVDANGKVVGEVYLGYCPTKAGSVKLEDAACDLVKTYTNATYSYALLVPKKWLTQATSSDEKTVITTPDITTTEFFQVTVLDNPTQLSAKNYYLNLNPGVDSTKVKDVAVNGLDGALSLDESTVYFVRGTKVYIVSFNTDALTKANLRTTFMVMYRSFHLVAASATNSNTNTNANANTNANSNRNANTNT